MMLKVCGLRYEKNITEVLDCNPDFIGFIFYEKSPRFIGTLDPDFVKNISEAKKVGVFVNASFEHILESSKKYGLDLIQLHGDESLELVTELKAKGHEVIKVFRVLDQLPKDIETFASVSKYFLLDNETGNYGGSGQHFDWEILNEVSHPFLISGGVGLEDMIDIKNLELENLVGIDVNSRFETEPGMKDIEKIMKLRNLI